jgi:hypothetical protein
VVHHAFPNLKHSKRLLPRSYSKLRLISKHHHLNTNNLDTFPAQLNNSPTRFQTLSQNSHRLRRD